MDNVFTTFFPVTFPALALAHFLALLSPGPDFFLITGHAIRHRLSGSLLICLGIALGNAVYIALAIAGWSGLRNYPLLFQGIEIAGALYLIWMGILLLRSAKRPAKLTDAATTRLTPRLQLAAGFASAILNPKNAIFYLSLMTTLIGQNASLKQQMACGTWMFAVVLFWDAALAACIGFAPVQRLLASKIALIEGIAGGVLLALACGILIFPYIGQ